jgi:hypothetical protein
MSESRLYLLFSKDCCEWCWECCGDFECLGELTPGVGLLDERLRRWDGDKFDSFWYECSTVLFKYIKLVFNFFILV